MLDAKTRQVKRECWQSQWRGVGETASGRPMYYIKLSLEEMLVAAKTGRIRVPDSQIPLRARRQRDRLSVLEGIGVLNPEIMKRVALA